MPNDKNAHATRATARLGRLAGKTAIITGGAAGMGRATSLAFADEGAAVAIFDIQKEAGEEVVDQIRQSGGTAEFIEADVSDAAQVDAAFDKVAETIGPYNVLFNHAAQQVCCPFIRNSTSFSRQEMSLTNSGRKVPLTIVSTK